MSTTHGQRDADHPGEHAVARLVGQPEQVQHPGGRLRDRAGEAEADQPDRRPGRRSATQVLQVVAQDVGLVDVALPDQLHPDAQLVHRPQPRVEEADQRRSAR